MAEEHPSAWAVLGRTIVRFEKQKIVPWIALRSTIGIVAPLAIGVAVGNPAAGAVAATGALNVSFSDGSDPYFRRGGRMLTATGLGAVAVVVGSLFGWHALAGVVLAAGWAFAAGMLVALDNAAGDIGLISLVTLVVYSAQRISPDEALYAGLLALAGGLLQTSLALAFWPLRRHEPERRAVAEVYHALAYLAGATVKATEAPPATAEFSNARKILAGLGLRRSNQAERYWSLVNQAERIRLSLLMLARLEVRLERDAGSPIDAEMLRRVRALSSRILREIGSGLLDGGKSATDPELMSQFAELAVSLHERHVDLPSAAALLADSQFQVDALAGQLRTAVDLAAYSTPVGREIFERRESEHPWAMRIAGSIVILRANLSLESAAFRHAVRLAVCIGIGTWLGRTAGWERSYWVPMTVAIVLKPDFAGTFSRGILRLAGTGVGLALATALFHFLPLTAATEVALLGVFAYVMRCFGPANYGVFVVAISALVVLLFALIGVAPADVIGSRAVNTAAGGALALALYSLWPTWERTRVAEALAHLLDSYRTYFRAVRDRYAQPDHFAGHDLDAHRLHARLARSNLEASVERLRSEPGVQPEASMMLNAMLASSHRFVHALMALEAGLARSHPAPARSAFATFADHVELTLHSLSAALRGSPLQAEDLPDLRADHHALVHAGDPLAERYALVNVEADRLTNSLNTLREQVLEWTGPVAFAPRGSSKQ